MEGDKKWGWKDKQNKTKTPEYQALVSSPRAGLQKLYPLHLDIRVTKENTTVEHWMKPYLMWRRDRARSTPAVCIRPQWISPIATTGQFACVIYLGPQQKDIPGLGQLETSSKTCFHTALDKAYYKVIEMRPFSEREIRKLRKG